MHKEHTLDHYGLIAYTLIAIAIIIASTVLMALGHDGALVGILVGAAAWAFGAGMQLRRPPQ